MGKSDLYFRCITPKSAHITDKDTNFFNKNAIENQHYDNFMM